MYPFREQYEKKIDFSGFDDFSILGHSWGDIPDMDAGRIPFPMSKQGRYAIGERKTAIVLLIGYSPYVSFEQYFSMLSSLSQVMQSKSNRLFVDVGLVLYRSDHEKEVNEWKEQFLKMNQDCQVFLISQSSNTRPSISSAYSLRSSLLSTLEKANYEQVIVITVDFVFYLPLPLATLSVRCRSI